MVSNWIGIHEAILGAQLHINLGLIFLLPVMREFALNQLLKVIPFSPHDHSLKENI